MTHEEALTKARKLWPKSPSVCAEEKISLFHGIDGYGSGGNIVYTVWGFAPNGGEGRGHTWEEAFTDAVEHDNRGIL